MKRYSMFMLILLAVVIGAPSAVWAATNETVSVQAKQKDNPQQNPADVEGHFQSTPTADKDEIHVTNGNVTGEGAGVYNDPVNDSALLTITQDSGPVKVDVEGRDGIGAMYWVTVVPGGGGGEKTILWADVEDIRVGALTLTDRRTQYSKQDATDSPGDAPIIYCTGPLPDGTGQIKIDLDADGGSYDWYISGTAHSGTLSGPYWVNVDGLEPGNYSVVVTNSNDSFNRTIDFAVIEYGEYSPSYTEWPSEEIPVSMSDGTEIESHGGDLLSIQVSAPKDGSEGASNPYEYGTNYEIVIDQDTGQATIYLDYAGVFMVQLRRGSSMSSSVTSYSSFAYQSGCNNPLDPSDWPIVLILAPHWDYNLSKTNKDVGMPLGQNSYAWVGSPKAQFSSWHQAGDANSVASLVSAKYAANGNNKIDLTIDAHGSPGTVSGDYVLTKNNVAVFGASIQGKVKRIRFYSCKTARNADGITLLQNLSNAASVNPGDVKSSAYKGTVYWGLTWSAGSWGSKEEK